MRSTVPLTPVTSENVYLPPGGSVSCLDAVNNGSRYVCLADTGAILEWTRDNQFRRLADGFKGPLQARASPDGSIWVLDYGLGMLFRISREGTVSEILGSGSNTDILRPGVASFGLRAFILPAAGPGSGVEIASDGNGNLYIGLIDEAFFGLGAARQIRRKFAVLRIRPGTTTPELFWDASAYFAERTDALRITALAVDPAQNICFVINGKLFRRTGGGTVTELAGGRYAALDADPVKTIISGADGDYILHTVNGMLFRLAFGELRVELEPFGRLDGVIARQGTELVGIDLAFKRLTGYVRNATGGYAARELGKLAQLLPVLGSRVARQPLERPVSVTTDRESLLLVVEEREGSVYGFANDNVVSRIARSTYDPANPPPSVLRTESFTLDTLPYRVVAAASSSEGRLHLVDRACNLLVQTEGREVRMVHRLLANSECGAATILFDAGRRVIVALHSQGQLLLGSGNATEGEWTFGRIYSASTSILSAFNLPSGEIFVLEGNGTTSWQARRVNPVTSRAIPISVDPNSRIPNLRLSSASADSSGRIIAVTCCTGTESGGTGTKQVVVLSYSGTALTGIPTPVTLMEALPGEQPEAVFPYAKGLMVRASTNRLFTGDLTRVRSADSLPAGGNRLSLGGNVFLTFTPGQKRDLTIKLTSGFTFVRFRSSLLCTGIYSRYASLGPAAGVAPANLTFTLDTEAVSLINGSCTITVRSDNYGEIARSEVFLVPDNLPGGNPVEPSRNDISVFDSPAPFSFDVKQTEVQRSIYIHNRAADRRIVRISAPVVAGLTVEPAAVDVPAYSFGTFVVKITPSALTRQSYSLPLSFGCTQCIAEEIRLSFQVTQNPVSIDLSAESALIDEGVVKVRNQNLWTCANVVLSGLQESDLVVQTDFPGGTKPWFTVKKGPVAIAPDQRTTIRYDLLLDRAALPRTAGSATVIFAPAKQGSFARRFVTVFFVPEAEGTQSKIIGFEGGSAVSLTKGQVGRLSIPLHSRSDSPLTYTAYAVRGEETSAVLYSVQGTVAKGLNSIDLNIERSLNAGGSNDSLDIVVAFSNSEKMLYRLDVVNGELSPTDQLPGKNGERRIGKCAARNLFITPREPALPFTVRRNIGMRFVLELRDNCGQLLNSSDGAKLVFNVSPPNGPVTTTNLGNGIWEIFWRPEVVAENVSLKIVAARVPNESEVYAGQLTISGTVSDTSVPSVRGFSVVDGASFAEKQITAPGAVISIFGENLAPMASAAGDSSIALPREIEGLSVQINSLPVPLWYVSPTQVNIQVPTDLPPAEYRVFVKRGAFASAPAAIAIGAASPGIFTVNQRGSGQGQVWYTGADGNERLASPESPVSPDSLITIYANGLGATTPALVEGMPVPSQEGAVLHEVRGQIEVLIALRRATLKQAYLVPGLIGVYAVVADIPPETPPGSAVPLQILVNGAESQIVSFAVR